MNSQLRANILITVAITTSFGLINLLHHFSLVAFLFPWAGPYVLHFQSDWVYGQGTTELKVWITALLAAAGLFQWFPKLKTPGSELRNLAWGVSWFLWCSSSYLMLMSTLG